MANRVDIENDYANIGLDRHITWVKSRNEQEMVWAKLEETQATIADLGRDDTRTYIVRAAGYDIRQALIDDGVQWVIIGLKPLDRRGWIALDVSYLRAV